MQLFNECSLNELLAELDNRLTLSDTSPVRGGDTATTCAEHGCNSAACGCHTTGSQATIGVTDEYDDLVELTLMLSNYETLVTYCDIHRGEANFVAERIM